MKELMRKSELVAMLHYQISDRFTVTSQNTQLAIICLHACLTTVSIPPMPAMRHASSIMPKEMLLILWRKVGLEFSARITTNLHAVVWIDGDWRVQIVAIKDIPKRTEILMDYGKNYWTPPDAGTNSKQVEQEARL